MNYNDGRNGWWTILQHGTYSDCAPAPRGPWHSEEEAVQAWRRWRARLGQHADAATAATSARFSGPYRTRQHARDTDISTYPSDIRHSWID